MNKRDHPLWETLVMVASFALLWAWILARQSAKVQRVPLWSGWTFLQILALAALAFIFIRRMLRVRAEMKKLDPRDRRQPPAGRNGHSHK